MLDTTKPHQTKDGYEAKFLYQTPGDRLVWFVAKPDQNETVIMTDLDGKKLNGGMPNLWNVVPTPKPDREFFGAILEDGLSYRLAGDHVQRDYAHLPQVLGQVKFVMGGETGKLKSVEIV